LGRSAFKELLALTRNSGVHFVALTATSISLADAGGFASKLAEIVELSPPNAASLNQVDVVDYCGMKRKNSLDAYSKTGFSYRYRFASTTVLASDYNALKSL
jgi:hypothetical protein